MRGMWKRLAVLAAAAVMSGCAVTIRTAARPGWVVYGRSYPSARVVPRPRTITFAAFYDALAPDGEWLALPPHGFVWRPHPWVVGADFIPYGTGGTWTWTEAGWQFQGEWAWSWATFHYGRWLRDPAYGWVWVPGTVWAPAWVEWRMVEGYVGWAPLGPTGVSLSVRAPGWSFVEGRYFGHRQLHRYYLPPEQVAVIHGRFHAAAPVTPRAPPRAPKRKP